MYKRRFEILKGFIILIFHEENIIFQRKMFVEIKINLVQGI